MTHGNPNGIELAALTGYQNSFHANFHVQIDRALQIVGRDCVGAKMNDAEISTRFGHPGDA